MKKTVFLLIWLLSGCDMVMKSDIKQLPDSFEVEEFIYTHGRFPDCYSSVTRVTEKSAAMFAKNKDAFRHSEYLDRHYDEWKTTPVPPELLDEERLESIRAVQVIESGVSCHERKPDKIKPYSRAYWDTIESGGGYYSFSASHNIFILFLPEKRLLFHSVR